MEPEEPEAMMPDNPLMRKKKTPEELAAEAEAAEQDDFTSESLHLISTLPTNYSLIKNIFTVIKIQNNFWVNVTNQ